MCVVERDQHLSGRAIGAHQSSKATGPVIRVHGEVAQTHFFLSTLHPIQILFVVNVDVDVDVDVDGLPPVAVRCKLRYMSEKSSNISKRRRTARAKDNADYVAKRAEVLGAAATLFKEQGFHSTRLVDVAREAGLDRATIYYYAGSKEELLQDIVGGVLDTAISAAEALRADETLTGMHRLHTIFLTLMTSYEENYPATFVYIQEQMHQVGVQETEWAQAIVKRTRLFDRMLIEFIQQGISEGDLRSDIPPRVHENALFGMLNWTHRWFVPGKGLTGPEVAEYFWSIYTGGALTDSGRSKARNTAPILRAVTG